MRAPQLVLLTASSLLCGCPLTPEPPPGAEATVEDLPYQGQAFPSRRTPLAVPSAGMALVPASEADALAAFDAATADSLATLPVGRDPVGFDGPVAIAVDAVGGVVYIALAYPELYEGVHAAHEGHGETLGWIQQLALDDLRVLSEVEVDAAPSALAVSQDGRRLAVTHFTDESMQEALDAPDELEFARGRLAVSDTEGFGAASEPDKVRACVGSTDVALSRPDGSRAFVSCYGEDALAILDLADASAPALRVAVGPSPGPPGAPAYGPVAAVLSQDGTRIAVPCEVSREIRLLGPSGSLLVPAVARIGVPVAAAWSADGARLWVAERDPAAISVLDANLAEVSRRELASAECAAPLELVAAGTDRLLLSCAGDDATDAALLVLDAATLDTVASAVLAKPSLGLAWAPGPGGRR
jgi:DNA-binding beta-propeller fold protein YncE